MLYLNIKYYLSRRLHNWFGAWRRRTKGWRRGGLRKRFGDTFFCTAKKNSGHVRNPTGDASPAFLPSRAFRHRRRPMVDTMFGSGGKKTHNSMILNNNGHEWTYDEWMEWLFWWWWVGGGDSSSWLVMMVIWEFVVGHTFALNMLLSSCQLGVAGLFRSGTVLIT